PGTQAEAGAVARADDLAGFHFTAFQRLTVMGAAVFDAIEIIATAHDDQGKAVDFDGEGSGLGKVRGAADIDPGHFSNTSLSAVAPPRTSCSGSTAGRKSARRAPRARWVCARSCPSRHRPGSRPCRSREP